MRIIVRINYINSVSIFLFFFDVSTFFCSIKYLNFFIFFIWHLNFIFVQLSVQTFQFFSILVSQLNFYSIKCFLTNQSLLGYLNKQKLHQNNILIILK